MIIFFECTFSFQTVLNHCIEGNLFNTGETELFLQQRISSVSLKAFLMIKQKNVQLNTAHKGDAQITNGPLERSSGSIIVVLMLGLNNLACQALNLWIYLM